MQVCTLFKINSPMWMGSPKKRAVGLDISRISKHNEVEFTYVSKRTDEKSIPDHFYFDGDKLKQLDFQRQSFGHVTVAIIPFSELEILERVDQIEYRIEPQIEDPKMSLPEQLRFV
jgi:hypothetical protein